MYLTILVNVTFLDFWYKSSTLFIKSSKKAGKIKNQRRKFDLQMCRKFETATRNRKGVKEIWLKYLKKKQI